MGVDTKVLLRGNLNIFEIATFLESQKIVRPDMEFLRRRPSRVVWLNISLTFLPPDEFLKLNFGWMSDEAINNSIVQNGFVRREKDDVEHRNLSVFWKLNNSESYNEVTKGEDFTLIHMGMWGSSVQIAELLGRKFGGFIMRNDCSDDWEPIEKVEEVA